MTTPSSLNIGLNAQLHPGDAGGTAQNFARLVRALSAVSRGETVTLIGKKEHSGWLQNLVNGPHRVLAADVLPPAKRLTGFRTGLYTLRRTLRAVMGQRSFAWYLRRAGVNVVHFPFQQWHATDLPFIYEPWDLQHLHLPEFFTPVEIQLRETSYRQGCEQAALVVTACHWTKQDIIRHYGIPSEKIAVIRRGAFDHPVHPLAPDQARQTLAALGLESGYLLFPAKDFPHKNHLLLFEALARVRRRGLDARLVCCGRLRDKNRHDWTRYLEQLALTGQVHLLGRVEDSVMPALYCGARALVFPSLFEGLGIPILEAFAYGLPVVTTRVTCIPEVAQDAAFYADGRSADSLADAIARIYTEESAVAHCRRRGRELLGAYDWEQAARLFLACYHCLTGTADATDQRLFQSTLTAPSGKAA